MAWSIDFTETAIKQLKKRDKIWQAKILDYFEDNIAVLEDPRIRGKALTDDKKAFWRYRAGNYRIICQMIDKEFIILAISIGHRKVVYKKH